MKPITCGARGKMSFCKVESKVWFKSKTSRVRCDISALIREVSKLLENGSNFLALRESESESKGGVELVFLIAITHPNKAEQICIRQWGKTTYHNNLSAECQVESSSVGFTLFSFILLIHWLSASVSSLHLYDPQKTKKNPTICTFCLIKGLASLPRSCRKAPFISYYWIFVCVVSVFIQFYAAIHIHYEAAEGVSGRPEQCHAGFK